MYAKDYREVLNYYDSEGNRGKTRNALIGWKEREDNEDDVWINRFGEKKGLMNRIFIFILSQLSQ